MIFENYQEPYLKFLLFSLALASVGCSHNSHVSNHHKLKEVINSPSRSMDNKQRDVYRHPLETLEFFEISSKLNVIEISPGGGWYTEILAPLLKDNGKLSLTIFDDSSPKDYKQRLNKKIKTQYSNLTTVSFDEPDYQGPIGPDNSADRVLTFRNVHNWMKAGKLKKVLESFNKVLKPGGVLGIVEHRASNKVKQDPKALNGYVREDYLIEQVEAAGFEFIAKSEVNANYNDSKDHAEGVWTLPPSLRLKEKNKYKYLAIGESDRMTLKFRKK